MNLQMKHFQRTMLVFLTAAALLFSMASPASAQKEKKQKKKKNAPGAETGQIIPMEDQQQIDYMISQMLGAWQVGDVEKLHTYFADDVSIVNGAWAPPILGWANYLAVYQQARTRMQQVRMDRDNSYIKVSGNFAWACYQWEFNAVSGDEPTASRGQTTLIFEKRNGRWLIIHNHTSLIETAHAAAAPGAPQPPASQPVSTP